MKVFRYIWNALFGKSKEQEKYKKGGILETEKKDDFFVSNEIIQKEVNTDKDFLSSENKPKKKKRNKSVVGKKTLDEIKEYLITYGSLDVLTCEQKFKVKSLRNFIWFLRNEGFEIKTDRVGLHNELGQKVEVTNYILINKK
jgi:hypothetical protein